MLENAEAEKHIDKLGSRVTVRLTNGQTRTLEDFAARLGMTKTGCAEFLMRRLLDDVDKGLLEYDLYQAQMEKAFGKSKTKEEGR